MKLTPNLKNQYREIEADLVSRLSNEQQEEIEQIRRDMVKMIDSKFERLLSNIDEYLQVEMPKIVKEILDERSQG